MNIVRYPLFHEWYPVGSIIKSILPNSKNLERPLNNLRQNIDPLFYFLLDGIQWCILSSSFHTWQTMEHLFSKWKKESTAKVLIII